MRADYGEGSGCPTLAVPVGLEQGDIWHNESTGADYRDIYPVTEGAVTVVEGGATNKEDCVVNADAGNYYDGANHLWVLEYDYGLRCGINGYGNFRAGDVY